MWVFTNDAFLSIVRHRDEPENMMVRARLEGDIEKVFPEAEVLETPDADYRFRAVIPRWLVATRMAAEVGDIDYTNFKNSVAKDAPGRARHDVYLQIWSVMMGAQRAALRLRNMAVGRKASPPPPRPQFDDVFSLFSNDEGFF